MKQYPLLPVDLLTEGLKERISALNKEQIGSTIWFWFYCTPERGPLENVEVCYLYKWQEELFLVKFVPDHQLPKVREALADKVQFQDIDLGTTYRVNVKNFDFSIITAGIQHKAKETSKQIREEIADLWKTSDGRSKFRETMDSLKEKGGYATREAWFGGYRKVYYFSPVAHGVEKILPDGEPLPMASFYLVQHGDSALAPYNPTSDDLRATDWQIFRKGYVHVS